MTHIKLEKTFGRVRNRPLKDYTGLQFGRLTAVSFVRWDGKRPPTWLFKCECGNSREISVKSAVSGHTTSCGCVRSEQLIGRNTKHGLSRSERATYRVWKDMKSRCYAENNTEFHNYGGRGIAVCDRWLTSFESFFHDMGRAHQGMTIDRINVDRGYEPGNCRWADNETQANNKRNTRKMVINGEVRSLVQWCRHFGVSRTKAEYRLKNGLDPFSKEDFRL